MVDGDITPRGSNKISDSNLYGPWMVVENRRRRTISNTRIEVGNTSRTQALQGSRFAALALENNVEHVVAPLSGDGGARKGLKESTRKGLHVKKPSASRVQRSSVVEWVQSAHARVDILGQQVADGRNEKFVTSTNEQTDMCASDEDNFGDTIIWTTYLMMWDCWQMVSREANM
ncbi:hypothetical protein V6N13_041038 [Hibiscus sabdariffa]